MTEEQNAHFNKQFNNKFNLHWQGENKNQLIRSCECENGNQTAMWNLKTKLHLLMSEDQREQRNWKVTSISQDKSETNTWDNKLVQ